MYKRLQKFINLEQESCFLWGPRQTGKSTLLKTLFPSSPYYDLLLSDEFSRLTSKTSLLREELLSHPPTTPVIIDEVQKIPALLDEIQWLIVNHHFQFILCGSSARKLKRGGGNLLGGRALRYGLYPLCYKEISDFNLLQALNRGLLPRHYLSENYEALQQAYVNEYLKEEIAAEAITRNIPAFARFLEVAAFSNGSIVNYNNIARECGISAGTVKNYFQILVDTMIGEWIPAYQKKIKRRIIQASRFYLFDIGIANHLLKRRKIEEGSEAFGFALEHFIFQEIKAYSNYSGKLFNISYWRTASQIEVDFILGEGEVALEVKSSKCAGSQHFSGLNAFGEDASPKKKIIVSLDPKPRLSGEIHILPWKEFLEKLWRGEII